MLLQLIKNLLDPNLLGSKKKKKQNTWLQDLIIVDRDQPNDFTKTQIQSKGCLYQGEPWVSSV